MRRFIRDVVETFWWDVIGSVKARCGLRTTLRYALGALDEVFIAQTHMTPSDQREYIEDWYGKEALDG